MNCLLCKKYTNKIIAKQLRDGTKSDVYFCEKCELGFLPSSIISEKKLKEFYEKKYRKIGTPTLGTPANPAELFKTYSKFQSQRIKLLRPHLKKKDVLLEMGCSAGMFLHKVKPYVNKIYGLDFDKTSAEWAAKKCRCTVFSDELKNTNLTQNSLDAVCAFQTLEHANNPEKLIKEIRAYLKTNGLIAIEVPNLYDALAHIYDLPNYYKFFFHKAHIWYFTKKSLGKLMRKLGFEGEIYHMQDYNILNHMHWLEQDTPSSNCERGLSSPIFPFKKTVSSKIKNELNKFIQTVDDSYKKKLEDLEIASNIMFIGRKNTNKSRPSKN